MEIWSHSSAGLLDTNHYLLGFLQSQEFEPTVAFLIGYGHSQGRTHPMRPSGPFLITIRIDWRGGPLTEALRQGSEVNYPY